MSAPAVPAAPAGPANTGVAGTDWLHRNRPVLVITAAVLATVVALTLLAGRSSRQTADLDPDNPSPDGAQALARVLASHGVDVTVARGATELAHATVDGGTTVMVTSSQNLGRTTARQLARRTSQAGAVVLADPAPTLVEVMGLPLSLALADVGRRTPAHCADPLLSGLSVDTGPTAGYQAAAPDGERLTQCFPTRPRGSSAAGSLVARVDHLASAPGGPTYAVAGIALLTNRRIARADNAAVALRLLGQQDRLLWYVPDVRDVAIGDTGSVAAQLPRGLVPALWLVVAAVLATMLWRGRRLGPLVVEPLPVAVKAVESTQGRGRLYRRVRDRDHAAAVLRGATVRRLAAVLRLPAGTPADQVARAVADLTGRDAAAVHHLLETRPVADDSALTRLAGDLAGLEREVHRP